jgi:hypothetical protein
MNWDAIGAIGELLGAGAVVVTLAYLAVQLRQNTATVRSNSATAHTQAVQAVSFAITQNAEVNKLWWSGLANRAALDEEERRRFDGILSGHILVVEQGWRFREEGVIDDVAWVGQRNTIRWLAHEPGFIDYWKVYGAHHHPGFGAVVAEAMSEEPSAAIAPALELTASADPSRNGNQA